MPGGYRGLHQRGSCIFQAENPAWKNDSKTPTRPAAYWGNVNQSRSSEERGVQGGASETEKRLGSRRQRLARLRRRDDCQGKVLRIKRFIRCCRQNSSDSWLKRLQLRD